MGRLTEKIEENNCVKWKEDKEYCKIIDELLMTDLVKALGTYVHHRYFTRLEHSLSVSYKSYLLAKRFGLDYVACARAGLLHDLFLYNRGEVDFSEYRFGHLTNHPVIALKNAEKITDLTDKERDIILKHMFLITWKFPKYKESWVVTYVDKLCSVKELKVQIRERCKQLKCTVKVML